MFRGKFRTSDVRSFFVAIIFIQLWSCSIECAWGAKKTESWISVPVFFATTRAEQTAKSKYTGARNLDKTDQSVEYGIVTIAIQINGSSDVDKSSMVKLGWKEIEKSKRKEIKLEKLSREDFYKALQGRHQSTKHNETCVFVHGYNNKFEGAAGSAAQLELALKEPVILFSWPSVGKLKAYTVDECNAEWSVRPFQVFMQGLEDFFGSKHLMTVSHSMGNRLINWYLQSRYDKSNGHPARFSEVVLTSPDIDRATFKNYFYKVAANGEKTRIFVSAKDIPLRLSKFLHGSPRTGADLSSNENKWDIPGNIEGTQSVNFTDVDAGKIGHSIQYKVIGSMHREGKPGEGLTLEEDKTFKGNYVWVRNERSAEGELINR